MSFLIEMESWDSAEHDIPEVCQSAGSLKISANSYSLTRNEDDWSKTVKNTTRVSAYPLAMWLAASWWRLRWEPLPSGIVSSSWRMAHELSASGYGFLWPKIAFACDGESMQIWSAPSRPESKHPVRYLADRQESIPIQEFETAVSSFIEFVLNRFDELGLGNSDLKSLWAEACEEQSDKTLSDYRRIEAILGYDPDEVDSVVVEEFLCLVDKIGVNALGEIASACSSPDPIHELDKIKRAADLQGLSGRFDLPVIKRKTRPVEIHRPWLRGHELARSLRVEMGDASKPISDDALSSLIGLNAEKAFDSAAQQDDRLRMGIGIRDNNSVKLVLRRNNRPGRRFELSRLICDHLLSDPSDCWLPTTDTKMIRQKWQRSFAAEFLCPIDALTERLDNDFTDGSIEEAAEYFSVSEKTVTSQLVNHNLLPSSVLYGESSSGNFPYLIQNS